MGTRASAPLKLHPPAAEARTAVESSWKPLTKTHSEISRETELISREAELVEGERRKEWPPLRKSAKETLTRAGWRMVVELLNFESWEKVKEGDENENARAHVQNNEAKEKALAKEKSRADAAARAPTKTPARPRKQAHGRKKQAATQQQHRAPPPRPGSAPPRRFHDADGPTGEAPMRADLDARGASASTSSETTRRLDEAVAAVAAVAEAVSALTLTRARLTASARAADATSEAPSSTCVGGGGAAAERGRSREPRVAPCGGAGTNSFSSGTTTNGRSISDNDYDTDHRRSGHLTGGGRRRADDGRGGASGYDSEGYSSSTSASSCSSHTSSCSASSSGSRSSSASHSSDTSVSSGGSGRGRSSISLAGFPSCEWFPLLSIADGSLCDGAFNVAELAADEVRLHESRRTVLHNFRVRARRRFFI